MFRISVLNLAGVIFVPSIIYKDTGNSTMAQRKKKLTKKKRRLPSHGQNREPEVDSDEGDFELAAEIKNDDSVRFFSDRTSSDVCVTWIAILKLVVISGVRKIEFTPWNCFMLA